MTILVRNRIDISRNLESENFMSESANKSDRPFTHTAWILKTELVRRGRRVGRWIEEGVARIEPDGDVSWVHLHSLPIGGFDGRICLAKIGTSPPDVMPSPPRPGDEADGPDGDDDQGA
jgi:hypothetical protein